VDVDGSGESLGCDPLASVETGGTALVSAIAASPNTLFIAPHQFGGWQLVGIPIPWSFPRTKSRAFFEHRRPR